MQKTFSNVFFYDFHFMNIKKRKTQPFFFFDQNCEMTIIKHLNKKMHIFFNDTLNQKV